MPTGYTYQIEEGEVSFEEFVCNCARAFGACVTMRDDSFKDPLPDEFIGSDYHVKGLAADKEKLYDLERMTPEECKVKADKVYEDAEKYRLEMVEENETKNARYRAMLEKVRAWTPPTKDHQGLKDFMVDQITMSMHDTSGYYKTPTKRLTGKQWHKQALADAKQDIKYHEDHLKEEQDRARERTEWVQQLKASLGVAPNGVKHW